MAKRKKTGENLLQYFREVFTNHPEWLKLSDNSKVVEQWETDHSGTTMTDRIKKNMAACKSKLRAAAGIKMPGNRGGRRKKVVMVQANTEVPAIEHLEALIYDSINAARLVRVKKLDPVVRHLKRALAHIVLAFDSEV